jgi:hypothetical protein
MAVFVWDEVGVLRDKKQLELSPLGKAVPTPLKEKLFHALDIAVLRCQAGSKWRHSKRLHWAAREECLNLLCCVVISFVQFIAAPTCD